MGEYVFDHGWADAYRARRRALLPEASGRGAVHAGDRHAGSWSSLARRRTGTSACSPRPARCSTRRHQASPRCTSPSHRGRMGASRRAAATCSAPTSSSISPTRAIATSTISSPRSPRGSARRSAASGAMRWRAASRSTSLTGRDLTEAAWDAFFAFYMDTGSRKWGRPYLNRRFFSLIGERMADRILLVMAQPRAPLHRRRAQLHRLRHALRPLLGRGRGAALPPFRALLLSGDRLGASPTACRGSRPGAQGEHKLARGYRPATTYSAHWIADPGFRRAVADYLERERRQVADDERGVGGVLAVPGGAANSE